MFYILLTCWLGILQASLLKKDFTDMDLIVVPPIEAEIPLDTTILVLNKNKISAILPHTFNGLSRLDSLSLGYNLLTVFPNLSSVALTLESLSLNNNLITTIEAAHLEVLTRLKDLNLHVNHLAEIPDVALPALTTLYLSKNEFYHFPSLEQLGKSLAYINIHENFINYISVVSLQYLVSVEKLYVHGNQLKTAPVFCYSTTSTLTFKIRDNPVECDQRIGWLLTEGISPQGQCESPGHLKGKELDTLSYSELGVTRDMYNQASRQQSFFELIAENRYCRSMPIQNTITRTITECLLLCVTTPGCLFCNYKSDNNPFGLCHYSDPLGGQIYTKEPDSGQGWSIYIVQVHQ